MSQSTLTPLTMTPTAHEKREWARMAQAHYSKGLTAAGHALSAHASQPEDTSMALADFDQLQNLYRAWLVFGTMVEC